MNRKALLIVVKTVVVAAIIVFLAKVIYENAADLREVEFSFSPLPFIVSCLLILVLYLMQSFAWQRLLVGVAHHVPLLEAMAVWFASQVAKYVPGKVMLPLVRFSLCKRCGIDIGRTTMSIYLELTLMTGSIIVVFFLSSLGWAGADVWPLVAEKLGWPGAAGYLSWLVLLVVPISLICIHPRLLEWLINLGLRALKKEPMTIEISYPRMLLLFAWDMLGWCFYAAGCWLLMVCLGESDPHQILRVTGAFTFSWIVGFLSFVTPGGLGVREALLTGMLSLWQFPLGVALAAAVLGRLQWTGMELVGAALTIRHRPLPLGEADS